ncbi:MAG: hypothetical protein L3K14_03990 [Thermoplasmata archaeon]|nr:hypothetical protein [Thermoplasmata archaeon]
MPPELRNGAALAPLDPPAGPKRAETHGGLERGDDQIGPTTGRQMVGERSQEPSRDSAPIRSAVERQILPRVPILLLSGRRKVRRIR